MKEAKLIIDGKEYVVQMKDEDVKAVTRPKTGYEPPRAGESFYAITGEPTYTYYTAGSYDVPSMIKKRNTGDCYTDGQLAKDIARADKLYRKLRQWQALNDNPVNWGDGNWHYRIYYCYITDKVKYYHNITSRGFHEIYFSSEEAVEAAIKEFEDELIWYFTEFKQRLDEK